MSGTFGGFNFPTNPQQGWQCPVCRAVFAPTMVQCLNCRGEFVKAPQTDKPAEPIIEVGP